MAPDQSNDVESNDVESNDIESNDVESNEAESNEAESSGVESEGAESNDMESKGVESNDVESKGAENNDMESRGVESSDVESKDAESSDVESKGAESNDVESEGAESNDMESRGVESSDVESKDAESNDVESEGAESSDIESKGVESNDIESKDAESIDAESKDVEKNDVEIDNIQIKKILEAALMAVDKPLTLAHLHALFANEVEPVERERIKEALTALQTEYEDRGVSIVEVASGFRVQIDQELSPWISLLFEERAPKYTRALLETLALVAYRQPITRSEIEEVRGVSVSTNIIKTLLEREWVRVVGHKEVPGRPAMYATTKEFLDYFSLRRIDELPPLSELKDLDSIAKDAGFPPAPVEGTEGESGEDETPDDEVNNEELISKELSEDGDQRDAGNVVLH